MSRVISTLYGSRRSWDSSHRREPDLVKIVAKRISIAQSFSRSHGHHAGHEESLVVIQHGRSADKRQAERKDG